MKRICGILLALILAATLAVGLFACGGRTAALEPETEEELVQENSREDVPPEPSSAETETHVEGQAVAGGPSPAEETDPQTDEPDGSAGEEAVKTAPPQTEEDDPAPAPQKQEEQAGEAPEGGPSHSEDIPEQAPRSAAILVHCKALLESADGLPEEKRALVPEDGILLENASVPLHDGDTVYDILVRAAEDAGLSIEEKTSLGSVYIRGLGGICEFDAGRGSGWMYRVNGESPNYGCSRVTVSDGDEIEWYYVL